jgi:hypothetical protein
MRRLVLWLLVAAVIVVGLVFYFRFGQEISPVLGSGR